MLYYVLIRAAWPKESQRPLVVYSNDINPQNIILFVLIGIYFITKLKIGKNECFFWGVEVGHVHIPTIFVFYKCALCPYTLI